MAAQTTRAPSISPENYLLFSISGKIYTYVCVRPNQTISSVGKAKILTWASLSLIAFLRVAAVSSRVRVNFSAVESRVFYTNSHE